MEGGCVANLVARAPMGGMAAVSHGGVTLSEAPLVPITWVSPFRDEDAAVSAAIEAAVGVGVPGPNTATSKDGVHAVWIGSGQILILGAEVAPEGAAVADQSDGWAWFVLEGAGVRDVLARLTPVDIRDKEFPVGAAARTLLFHMTATLMRTGQDRFEVLVFRSMARTAAHELETAMRCVAARG